MKFTIILHFQGLTFFLGYSIFAAVLGMLQFGYNTGVINAPESVSRFCKSQASKFYCSLQNLINMVYFASHAKRICFKYFLVLKSKQGNKI